MKEYAVVHDYVHNTDGGSRLCLMLAEALDADFFCGFMKEEHPLSSLFHGKVHTLGVRSNIHLFRQFLLAQSFLTRGGCLNSYLNVIYSGFYAPLASHAVGGGVRHIYYCHTPPRFCYDQKEAFANMSPKALRPLLRAFLRWYRNVYEASLQRMDEVLTNSRTVQYRLERYLGLASRVVYPPCETRSFWWEPPQGYYLSMARHDRLKRLEVIVEAFRRLPERVLVLTSSGPETGSLRSLAKGAENIRFAGDVSDEQLRRLLARCVATVYIPVDEDFGMAAVESLAAGKPVIASCEGGLAEILEEGETAFFTQRAPEPEEVATLVQRMTPEEATRMREPCLRRASDFDVDRFMQEIRCVLEVPSLGGNA